MLPPVLMISLRMQPICKQEHRFMAMAKSESAQDRGLPVITIGLRKPANMSESADAVYASVSVPCTTCRTQGCQLQTWL